MQFSAKSKRVGVSPQKLRPLASAMRGKRVNFALRILATTQIKRVLPLKKMIESAVANAKCLENIEADRLVIKELRVDQGPVFRYFKPGAMGRTSPQRKRFSNLSVVLEPFEVKKD